MPHMMPMMWSIIMFSTLIILYIITNLIYFFYLPKLTNYIKTYKLIKWEWKW